MLVSSDSEEETYIFADLDSEEEIGDLLVASSSTPWREPSVSHVASSPLFPLSIAICIDLPR